MKGITLQCFVGRSSSSVIAKSSLTQTNSENLDGQTKQNEN